MFHAIRSRLARTCFAAALGAGMLAAAAPAAAQSANYPGKTIRLVIGFAAGGVTDIMARALGQRLTQQLGVTVYVDVRTGADSLIATREVQRAAPDGYTIYLASTAHVVNQSMFRSAGFDAVGDFTPISMCVDIPNVVVVHPSLPVASLGDFVRYAKSRDGALNYSSSASGTFLAAEMLLRAGGMNIQRVPYKGAAPAMVALLSNEVQMTVTGIGSVMPYLEGGKIRVLAIASEKRSVLAPNIPTAAEAGVPGWVNSTWYALIGPAGMPPGIVERLNAEVRKALADPEFVTTLHKIGAVPTASTPEELARFMRSETEKWKAVVVETKSQVD